MDSGAARASRFATSTFPTPEGSPAKAANETQESRVKNNLTSEARRRCALDAGGHERG